MDNVENIRNMASSQVAIFALDKATPENIMKKQKELHAKEGMSPKTLNVCFAVEMFPLLVSMMLMSTVMFMDMKVFGVYFESYRYVLLFSYIIAVSALFIYMLNKDFFGLIDKMILRSVKKSIKKRTNAFFAKLFHEEGMQMPLNEDTLKKAKEDNVINDDDIKYLKIKGNGIVKVIDVYNATSSFNAYTSFKQKVKEYF